VGAVNHGGTPLFDISYSLAKLLGEFAPTDDFVSRSPIQIGSREVDEL
jgi:hypothetical protein